MGVIKCKKHSLSGIRLVCPHLKERVLNKQSVGNVVEVLVKFFDEEEDEILMTIHYPFCNDCIKKKALSGEIYIPIEEEFIPKTESEKAVNEAVPVCANCFDELKVTDTHR